MSNPRGDPMEVDDIDAELAMLEREREEEAARQLVAYERRVEMLRMKKVEQERKAQEQAEEEERKRVEREAEVERKRVEMEVEKERKRVEEEARKKEQEAREQKKVRARKRAEEAEKEGSVPASEVSGGGKSEYIQFLFLWGN